MHAQELKDQLLLLAERLGYTVRLEALPTDQEFQARSGACKFQQQKLLILDSKLSPEETILLLKQVLQTEDLEAVSLTPAVRDYLETRRS